VCLGYCVREERKEFAETEFRSQKKDFVSEKWVNRAWVLILCNRVLLWSYLMYF